MALVLIIAFILFPVLEIVLMVKVGGAIGVLPMLALLFGMAIVGGLILRQQGLAVARRALDQLARHEAPVASMIDGVGLSLAGVLFLIPGMISDVAGLLLLVPAVRRWLIGRLLRSATVRFEARTGGYEGQEVPPEDADRKTGASPAGRDPGGARSGGGAPRGGVIIEGEFERLEERTIRPSRGNGGGGTGDGKGGARKDSKGDRSPWRK